MSAIDDLVQANERYAATFPGSPPAQPKLHLAVLTCMDARLDLFGALGLGVGDAHLMRNAGGLPTEDMLRSLAISQHKLGTREVAVIQHTQCGMDGFDDDAFRAELTAQSGSAPSWRVPGFPDLQDAVRRSVTTVRECPWLLSGDNVRGFVFDVATAALIEVR